MSKSESSVEGNPIAGLLLAAFLSNVVSLLRRLDDEGASCIPDLIASVGCTADEILEQCSARSKLEGIEVAIQNHGANVNSYVAMHTPLVAAAQTGASHSIRLLLRYGADPNQPTRTENVVTPLWVAAENGHLRAVHLLLKAGANVNAMNTAEHTPLFMACQNHHMFVAMELLRWGADPHIGREDPFTVALFTANPHTTALMVRSGIQDDVSTVMMNIEEMERTKKTCMGNKQAKVTSNVLQDMQDVILRASCFGRITPHPLLQQAHQAEQKGDYRRALSLIASLQTFLFQKFGPPPFRLPSTPLKNWRSQEASSDQLLWAQTKYDLSRLQDAVYGFENSDGRLSEWNQHSFDQQDVHPDKVVFYAWTRHENTIYRYGGRSLLSVV